MMIQHIPTEENPRSPRGRQPHRSLFGWRVMWLVITLAIWVCFLISSGQQALTGCSYSHNGLGGNDDQQTTWTAKKERGQAMLSNANDLVRLCSQRPERLLSSPDYVPTHHGVPRPHHLFTHQKIRFAHYRGLVTRLSRPWVDMPQSDYYVYRLRHLLC